MPTWKAYAKKDDITATKLDDLAAPDDNTDLNATAAAHGLLPKLSNVVTEFLNGTGVFSVPAAGGLTSKIKTSTRDMTADSGDVAYTGVGFTPTVILAFTHIATTVYVSYGFCDSAKNQAYIYEPATAAYFEDASNYIIGQGNLAAKPSASGQQAAVKSFAADGFTLTWTKNGTPSAGTINLYFLCLK
jgi:hypothetical protein